MVNFLMYAIIGAYKTINSVRAISSAYIIEVPVQFHRGNTSEIRGQSIDCPLIN